MIIDLILERKGGAAYDMEKFYGGVMDYESTFGGNEPDGLRAKYGISHALDCGTEADVKKALCAYVKGEDYNPAICDYINRVDWLTEE